MDVQHVFIGPSTISGAGDGLFSSRGVPEGECIFSDEGPDLFVAPSSVNAPLGQQLSSAWPLVLFLLREPEIPQWVQELTENNCMCIDLLKSGTPDSSMMSHVIRNNEHKQVFSLFCKVVTNYFTNNVVSCLGRRSCKINSKARTPNAAMQLVIPTDAEPSVRFVALRDIREGEEIFEDYGEEYHNYLR